MNPKRPFCVGITVLRQYDELEKCIEAVLKSNLRPYKILVCDNGLELKKKWHGVEIITPQTNLGCAGGWNCLLDNSYFNTTIILNDDCVVAPDTFDKMMVPEPPCVVLGHGWSCFRIDRDVMGIVGKFDDGFWPVYYEDCDYAKRMKLSGMTKIDLGNIALKHGNHGERPYQNLNPKELAWFHECFEKNKQRFIKKWGGLPSEVGV